MLKKKNLYKSVLNDEILTVTILGEIDHHCAAELRGDIDAEIYSVKPQKLMFDLSSVEFMDSSGLGLILGRFTTVKSVGGELIIKNPGKGVLKILKLAGIERLIKIEFDK